MSLRWGTYAPRSYARLTPGIGPPGSPRGPEVIHPGTTAALRALWLAQGRPSSGLVIRDAAGEPVDPDTYSARFRAVCRAAGVPALRSIHNVRHSLATALEAAGVPEHHAALLGHDVATYRRFYLVTDDEGAAAAAEVAGRLFAV